MNKILIFRTDRIGDFLISTPIFSSLKRKFKNCKIDIVCSNLNYEYIYMAFAEMPLVGENGVIALAR